MIKNSWLNWAFVGLVSFSIGCSSIKKRAVGIYLKNFRDKKAENIEFLPPPAPYEKQTHSVLDALWWNSHSQSSISYFSSCSKVKKTLEIFQKDSFPQDSQYKILKQSQSKESLYSVLEVSESQQKTYIGIYTIKKRECYFNINLVAASLSSFEKEESVFKTFIKGLK